ncbi:MAG: HipA family kinase [Acidobacteriota bacterium]
MRTLRTIQVTRYVTPLREGGSLPAIVEADDDGMYVLKFRGAGQGPRALIAELVSGEIGRALGLPVPEIVFAELDPDLSRTEPDPEIHALILESAGLNLALDYLPGSVTYDPIVQAPDADLASRIVWFDAFVTNVDRTARNTNMLIWHRRLWLIDHGATLYFHHAAGWESDEARPRDPFPMIENHVLFERANALAGIDESMARALDPGTVSEIVSWIPDAWLKAIEPGRDVAQMRAAYARYLLERVTAPRRFVEEALRGR